MRPLNRIIIHHSASPRLSTTRDEIDQWHKARGFIEIGYHWVIEAGGKVVPGRPLHIDGAHCLGHNHDSIGICVVGDNTSADPTQHWDGDQKQALLDMVVGLELLYPTIKAVYGHRDAPGAKTECPGLDVRALLGRS